MPFKGESELFDFVDNAAHAADGMRTQLAENFAVYGCYYEGIHWIGKTFRVGERRAQNEMLPVNYNPDARKIRAVDNDVTRLVQKSAAGTHPSQIHMDVHPPERDASPGAAHHAAVHEGFVNALVDDSGFVAAAQHANEMRCIYGVWGLTLAIEGRERCLCARSFDPTCLVLDPHCQERDLALHPYVMYCDTWTLDRIRSVFGIEIDPGEASTVEQLEPQKVELAQFSRHRMYSRYIRNSRTKAARVVQLHVREGRRFPYWYVGIITSHGDKRWVNRERPETPYGGCGMPMRLLHGYFRSDTLWSWGEVAQVRDDQDQKNLIKTLDNRILQNYAHHKTVVDKRAFGPRVNDDELRNIFDNRVGGVIPLELSDRVQNRQMPQILATPPPPQFIMDHLQRHTIQMENKVHKGPTAFGRTPTHVPKGTTEIAADLADQVGAVRIGRDMQAYTAVIGVMHATALGLLRDRAEGVVSLIREEGFDAQDVAVLLQTDPARPGVAMTVREATVRHRSTAQRKAELDVAAQNGLVTPDEYRQIMADTLETPLSEVDRQMVDQARKAATRIILGEPWHPRPLSAWNKIFIDVFTRAQFDPRAIRDPLAIQRLVDAIQSQYNMWYQERILANPEAAATAAQQPHEQGGGVEDGDDVGDRPVDVAELLDAITRSGGASGSAQPGTEMAPQPA